jgi:hypothetical protein
MEQKNWKPKWFNAFYCKDCGVMVASAMNQDRPIWEIFEDTYNNKQCHDCKFGENPIDEIEFLAIEKNLDNIPDDKLDLKAAIDMINYYLLPSKAKVYWAMTYELLNHDIDEIANKIDVGITTSSFKSLLETTMEEYDFYIQDLTGKFGISESWIQKRWTYLLNVYSEALLDL